MRVGIIVPQGWTGEYDGWDPARAWARTVAVAHEAEALGFDSLWLFDHFQTEPVPTDEITFEAFVGLSALAVETARVRLGHLVLCAGYRNPALVAKMISTLDVVSGGRAELALGAGWKEDEHTAYGFGFPPLKERMALLEDSLEVATRMLAPGRATYGGSQATVVDAINVPKGVQSPRVPIMVGGGGEKKTLRIVAEHADIWHSFEGDASLARKLEVLKGWCAEVGRPTDEIEISGHVSHVDPAALERQYERGVRLFQAATSGPDHDLTTLRQLLAWRESFGA